LLDIVDSKIYIFKLKESVKSLTLSYYHTKLSCVTYLGDVEHQGVTLPLKFQDKYLIIRHKKRIS